MEIFPTLESLEELNRVTTKLRRYYLFEEDFWRQKAEMRWFGEGDKNTKFFHSYVNGRRKKLNILESHTEQGDIIFMEKTLV